MFEPIIEDLLKLESEGIELTINGTKRRVYFVLALFIGDNLAVHGAIGFVESFRAKYPCRFCRIDSKTLQSSTKEIGILNRNKENYKEDLKPNNLSDTGIKNECIFNKLSNFGVTENIACDIMHDIFLGVARYHIALLINSLMVKLNLTLNEINAPIVNFDYGIDNGDKPPALSDLQLKSGCITIYASEMIVLIKYLPIMLADLIPKQLDVWEWFLKFRKICCILLSKSVQAKLIQELDNCISDYLELRLKLFPSQLLKPKHHFMVHYPKLLSLLGPLVRIWCMRFEAKHQILLAYARICKNKINIPYSIATKHQLH